MVGEDIQFDQTKDGYTGSIKIDPNNCLFGINISYSKFANEIIDQPEKWERIANLYGLYIETANNTELILHDRYQ